MKTLAYNNSVIARNSATFGSKFRSNLHEATSDLNKGDRFIDNHIHLDSNPDAPRDDMPGFFSKMILIGLMTLLLSPLSFAQDFDSNRMNRDIKIMENILDEVFKTTLNTTDTRGGNNLVFVNSLSDRNKIKGTYVPEYGVIFMIPNPTPGYISVIRNKNSDAKVVFEYASNESGEKMELDEESIITRISEFLKDYASTIGQLKDNERVMVVYGEKSENRSQFRVFNISGDAEEKVEEKPLPVITVSASKSDLNALRSGRINSDAFQNRLSITKAEGKEKLDIKVMSNILRTAFGEGDGDEFHLIHNGSLTYFDIENFGVLYTLDLHRGHGLQSFRFGSLTPLAEVKKAEAEKATQTIDKERDQINETINAEYEKLIERMKENIVDYGRTLNSLSSEEFLMISAIISDARDIVPGRVNFQIKKSTLEQLDRGQISREDAINAVTITEY